MIDSGNCDFWTMCSDMHKIPKSHTSNSFGVVAVLYFEGKFLFLHRFMSSWLVLIGKNRAHLNWLKLTPSQVLFAHYMLYFWSFRCCTPVHTDVACMVPAKLHSDLNNTLPQSIITYLLSLQTLLTPYKHVTALLVCVLQHILSMSLLVLFLLH